MNKMYLTIIGFLLVIALAVGGYAIYKTANQPAYIPPPATPPVTQTETPTTTPAPPPPPPEPTIPLTLTSPLDGAVASKAAILVSGKTAPNADVSVNDKDIVANSAGSFSTTLTLEEGTNTINVTAVDQTGVSAEKEITVTYEVLQ